MNRLGLFQVAGLYYALPLPRLMRIDQNPRCFALPKLPQGVVAVLVENASLVPMLDLQTFLETATVQAQPEYAVFAATEFGAIALPAEETCGIVAEQKGRANYLARVDASIQAGEFEYQQNRFIILDIDILTMRLTQACQ